MRFLRNLPAKLCLSSETRLVLSASSAFEAKTLYLYYYGFKYAFVMNTLELSLLEAWFSKHYNGELFAHSVYVF